MKISAEELVGATVVDAIPETFTGESAMDMGSSYIVLELTDGRRVSLTTDGDYAGWNYFRFEEA